VTEEAAPRTGWRSWFAATGQPPAWALVGYMAAGMAAVAVLTSLGAAAGPLGAVLGFLLSLAYLVVALTARTANLFEHVSFRWGAAHVAVGCLAGLLVVLVGTAWRRRTEPEEVRAATAPPIPVRPMWESLKTFDEHARDGVRRANPLAILMYFFQRNGGRDAFWIFFAAYLVMLRPGKNQKSQTAVRVGSAISRSGSSSSLPSACSCSASRPSSFRCGRSSGIGLGPAYPVFGGGLTTVGSVLLAGAPTGAIGNWAGRRVLDTVIGCAIALVATYLLWPSDEEADEPVPVTT
jgi:hypothetical protein